MNYHDKHTVLGRWKYGFRHEVKFCNLPFNTTLTLNYEFIEMIHGQWSHSEQKHVWRQLTLTIASVDVPEKSPRKC